MTTLDAFTSFDGQLSAERVAAGETVRVRSLATWAYIYFIPAFSFLRQRSEFIGGWKAAAASGATVTGGASAGAVGQAGVPPLGSWMLLPDLTSPATQGALPMNDCLYGTAHLELDLLGPMVIHLPANPTGRYFSVTGVDAYMNNFVHLGPQWCGNGESDHLLVPPDWTGDAPDGMAVIVAPTASVCLYNRVLVGYEDGDIDTVRSWRQGLTLTQLATWPQTGAVPADVPTAGFEHGDLRDLTDAFEYFRLCFDHITHNPGPEGTRWLVEMLASGGLTGPRDPALREAVVSGVADAQLILNATISGAPTVNGWTTPTHHNGVAGPYPLDHAVFQQTQIGSNDDAEAIYLFTQTDESGEVLDASGGAVYQLSFLAGSQPDVEAGGFWSLTMYRASDNLLCANDLNRYSTRTSRPGLVTDPDGTVTIWMSQELPTGAPPANWLPAPGEPFRLGVRVYYPVEPHGELVWTPPAVRRVEN
jgi:hypothetical protein